MEIIAYDIDNLTDARYFAAWGVSYIAYQVSDKGVSPDKLVEIISWIEGPKTSLIIDGLQFPDDLQEIVLQNEISSVIVSHFFDTGTLPSCIDDVIVKMPIENPHSSPHKIMITSVKPVKDLGKKEIETIQRLPNTQRVYLDIPATPDDIKVLENWGVLGLVIRGSHEEKTGYKSFEGLDEVMEEIFYGES